MKLLGNFLNKERKLFLLVIFIELFFTVFLIIQHRIPGGHDSFQYFTLQYYFLNNVVNSGQIPQWIPFMTHGTMATWWYGLSANIFQNILLHTGNLFRNVNFLVFFNIGIFVDKLILLIGVWLLAKRFFSSIFTVFFVTVTVMSSCIWASQIWWNFHFYYALPLILYFLHIFLERGRWRYLFLAGNLLVIQTLGNLPYFLSVTSLVIFLYFLFYFIFNSQEIGQHIKNIKLGWPSFVCILSIAILLILSYLILKIGTSQIAKYNPGRNLDGTVSLETFLHYAGNLGLSKWLELFSGVSPILDYTLYIGIICPALIVLGLILNLKKKYLHFFFLTLTLFFFSGGTLLSAFFYYSWPFMKFFRHLALVSPLIKLFLCFLSGFGLEAVLIHNKKEWRGISFISLTLVAFLLLGISLILFSLASDYYLTKILISKTVDSGFAFINYLTKEVIFVKSGLACLNKIFNKDILILRIGKTAVFSLILSILLGALAFIKVKKYRIFIVGFLLFLHLLNIYGYKFSESLLRTTVLTKNQLKITNFQNMPYPKRRSLSFWKDNLRALILIDPVERFLTSKYKIKLYGSLYWTNNAFLFKDQLDSPFRTDSWLIPLDNFTKTYWNQPINDLSVKPLGLSLYGGIKLPSENKSLLKISGVNEDKVQFFSKAYIDSDKNISSKIANPEYKGDILFLSYPENNKINSKILKLASDEPLSSNTRLHLPYKVIGFDSNNLKLAVNNPKKEPIWLFYSDVWHPFWKAKINGEETKVFKADLAYKAIQLEPGLNRVHFYFNSKLMSFLQHFFGLNSFIWLGILFWLIAKIFTKPEFS